MISFRRRRHEVPALNTSSLPDLIFTVLFFFMIVTHMRQVTVKVKYQVPQGKELTRLTKKSAVTYVYVGVPVSDKSSLGDSVCVQLNDKVVDVADITDYVSAEKNRMSAEDKELMTVSVKADRNTKMGVITDVKQALRQAKVLRINYSATENGK